jgi:uncharacterized protein (DUF433 family)
MDERERNELLPLHAERPPVRVDEGGAVRVGNSRISLDLVVEQYENGMTPEGMVRAYDTLVLADVYAVIAYYLRHKGEVQAYLRRRADEAEALRAKLEAERPLMAYSPRLQAILEASRKQIQEGEVLSHEEFWSEVEVSRVAKPRGQKRKASQSDR